MFNPKNGTSKIRLKVIKKHLKVHFNIENLYFRKDKIKNIQTKLKSIPISKFMGWCDDMKQ